MKRIMLLLTAILSGQASLAHDFTPTYPKLETTHQAGVLKASMKLFNKRNDIRYYRVGVYDSEWNKIPFIVSGGKVINVEYLDTKRFDVYIQESNRDRVTYICTKSLTLQDGSTKSILNSRICSKVK
jgi:hypothetical protein